MEDSTNQDGQKSAQTDVAERIAQLEAQLAERDSKLADAVKESRKWETRAKENRTASEQAAADAAKTAEERVADRLAKLEADLVAERLTALRARVQASHGISDEDAELFLTGTDADVLNRQAERLASRNTAPAVPRREGSNPRTEASDELTFSRRLVGLE